MDRTILDGPSASSSEDADEQTSALLRATDTVTTLGSRSGPRASLNRRFPLDVERRLSDSGTGGNGERGGEGGKERGGREEEEEEKQEEEIYAPISIAQLRSKFENLSSTGSTDTRSKSTSVSVRSNVAATSNSTKTSVVPKLAAWRPPDLPTSTLTGSDSQLGKAPDSSSSSSSTTSQKPSVASAYPPEPVVRTIQGSDLMTPISSLGASGARGGGRTPTLMNRINASRGSEQGTATASSNIPTPTQTSVSVLPPPTSNISTSLSTTLESQSTDLGSMPSKTRPAPAPPPSHSQGLPPISSRSTTPTPTATLGPNASTSTTAYAISRSPSRSPPSFVQQYDITNSSTPPSTSSSSRQLASESLAALSQSLPSSLPPSPKITSSNILRVPPTLPVSRPIEASSSSTTSSPSAPANMHFPNNSHHLPLRRAPPAVPSRSGSISATPGGCEDGQGEYNEKSDRTTSVKALRDMFTNHKVNGSDSPPSSRHLSYAEIKVNTAIELVEASPEQPINIKSKPPPPPPPISRSSSPSLLSQSDRSSKPNLTASPIATPPSLSRTPSSSSLGPARPPSAINHTPTTPPQLPARRPTLPPIDLPPLLKPPPLPANKPAAPSMTIPQSYDGSSLPLPRRVPVAPVNERPRSKTVGRVEAPSRRGNTISLPTRVVQPNFEGYQPPPPPVRNARTGSVSATSSPRKNTSNHEEVSSEDDEEVLTAGLSSTAQRQLEDYPVATQANRRPPSYVPDIRLASSHTITSFAVFGRHVCLAHHHVRVYDTQMSDQPLFSVDLKDVGLDFRIKEPRVTAMCFRPALHKEDEGRYVWCGTKDGHVWELDIRTGAVTSKKPFVHNSAVVYIFRHQKFVITLDDSGKVLVFEAHSDDLEPRLVRTCRISDKFTVAKMINGRLWTATAPPTRSTTNAASSRGPTVRIYDPCVSGSILQTTFTSEWAGAATSVTILPLDPSRVFIGHEGGFVSIWSGEEMTCTQVMKISASDIVSLEGVGERLWAGNRKGQIHVYDTSERPWNTTNIWTAHADQPVHSLVIDPWSIDNAGRFTLWSASREQVRAWDGLLAVDWIDGQMVQRQPDYCTFREIRVLVCSWNIDSAKPTDLKGSAENATFLEQCIKSVDSPDVIVFGFQEVIPLTDKKLTAKTLLFGNKSKDGVAADRVSVAYRQWSDKLHQAVRMASPQDCPYVKVHSESLVGLFTCMFVKSSEKDTLRDVNITTVKRGIGGIYGNKGAIVARMVLDDTSICFINVHLAAGQSQKSSRNADLAAIMEDKAIFPPTDHMPYVHGGDGTGILDHEMVILNGDLNYRIDQRRESVISNINAGDLEFLLEHDQLRKEMRNNHSFRLRSFEEAPITFAPTYKYDTGTNEYDSSEKRRIPAWCDRILYTKSSKIQSLSYRRYETNVSDHRPVSAGLALTVKAVDPGRMLVVRREVASEWAKRERDVLEAMADAYAYLF